MNAAQGQEPGPGWAHRPHLDGLRAVAVYLVVAFHGGVDRFAGGFIGVDVFFVLSGYLVTGVLMRDIDRRGSIDLARFYTRRIRRLIPAALLVLTVSGLAFAVVAAPAELEPVRRSSTAAALYVSNWFFITEAADYFATDIHRNLVLHFWSLSVEEQFYLAWPLILGGLVVVSRRVRRPKLFIQAAVIIAGSASVVAALILSRHDLNRAYYGTDTRAYQLLAGALLAITPGLINRTRGLNRHRMVLPAGSALCLAGLIATATNLVNLSPISRGVLTTILTVALLTTLESTSRGILKGLLSIRTVTYLGQISYGTYLWHWPVIVIVQRTLELGTPGLTAVSALVATSLASLSYQVLERPIRSAPRLDHSRWGVLATGVAASLILAIAVLPWIEAQSSDEVAAADSNSVATAGGPIPSWQEAKADRIPRPVCTATDPRRCTLVDGAGSRVLLIGDSHALALLPAFTRLAEQRNLEFSAAVLEACPWVTGMRYFNSSKDCAERQDAWYGPIIQALDPEVVVLADRGLGDPRNPIMILGDTTYFMWPDDPGYEPFLDERIEGTVGQLRAEGRRVVILEPIPLAPAGRDDPLTCLSGARDVSPCRFVASSTPLPEEQTARRLATEHEGVWSLDLDGVVCPYLPICDPVIDGLIVRRDASHLTATFARTLAGPIGSLLEQNGVLPAN